MADFKLMQMHFAQLKWSKAVVVFFLSYRFVLHFSRSKELSYDSVPWTVDIKANDFSVIA